MANNFDKNFTTKLAKGVLDGFESSRVLSKTVNTQKLDGKFNPDSGEKVLFKRPTDYTASRTSKGDLALFAVTLKVTCRTTLLYQSTMTKLMKR